MYFATAAFFTQIQYIHIYSMYWMQYFWSKNINTWETDLYSNTEDSYKHAVMQAHLSKIYKTSQVKNY